jgi:hypothetical protein
VQKFLFEECESVYLQVAEYLSFEVLMALGIKITVFMDKVPSSFVEELVYPEHEGAGSTKELVPICLITESPCYLTHIIGPLLAHLPLQP